MNKTKLFKISAFFGFLYILFILWLRLIHERLPRELDGNYNLKTYYWYHMFLILSIFVFIFYLRKILNIKPKYKILLKILEIPLIQKTTTFIFEYVLDAPFNFYLLIYNNFNLTKPVSRIGAFIWDNPQSQKYTKHFAIMLCIFKLIIAFCFIWDVIIFHKFNYFYKSLVLFLIILIIKCLIFILDDVSKTNREYISKNILTIQNNATNDAFYLDFQPSYNGNRTDHNMHHHFNYWVVSTANCMFTDNFYDYYNRYNNYISLIYYGIFIIGWSYVIFFHLF